MPPAPNAEPRRDPIAIVGGGLAGLAAAVALIEAGQPVALFESRRQLGGRAASFRDPVTDELIDYCQHVSMGCCTNLADFCRRASIDDGFERCAALRFFTRDGRRYDVGASRLLPAPLHLLPALARLNYLSWRDRHAIGHGILRLARLPSEVDEPAATWLRRNGQSDRAIECFWAVILTSALGESVERASIRYAQKVFVDAFLTSRTGFEVLVPRAPLSELFGRRVNDWLQARGASVYLERGVERVEIEDGRVRALVLDDGSSTIVSGAVVAVPWRRVGKLFNPALPELAAAEAIEGSPITGIHLWFDRPITTLDHAVLVGMTSQWLFNRNDATLGGAPHAPEHYYQVVVSASRNLESRARTEIVAEVVDELKRVFPATADARVLQARVVTDPMAVFSPAPGVDRLRPRQATSIPNLALAGDWTDTGWPATMEGAVRSGYAAAEVILAGHGQPMKFVVPDLPRSLLARWA